MFFWAFEIIFVLDRNGYRRKYVGLPLHCDGQLGAESVALAYFEIRRPSYHLVGETPHVSGLHSSNLKRGIDFPAPVNRAMNLYHLVCVMRDVVGQRFDLDAHDGQR